MGQTTFSGPIISQGGFIGPGMGGTPLFTGNYFYVDPANGADGNSGGSPTDALATLYAAYNKCVAGNDDVVVLMSSTTSSSTTAGTARLSTALAAAVDSIATTGTLTWAKNSTHLIGATAPTSIGQRARIAPPAAGTRAAVFNSGNFVVVTAQGCHFQNFDVFCGFATGGTSQIAWTDSGGRNSYTNVNIQGKGDAASAADTASRALLVTGSVGENTFRGCTIGLDTIQGANAACTEVELAGGSPRNRFEACVFEAYAGGTTASWVTIGASGIDRYALFRECLFVNPVLPTALNASVMANGIVVNAAPGGTVQVMNSMYYGAARLSAASGLVFVNNAAATKDGALGVASAT